MSSKRRYQDKRWLEDQLRDGKSPEEIADLSEVAAGTIHRWIGQHEITIYRDEAWLEEQISQYIPPATIADWFGVTEQTIQRWMRRYDIEYPGRVPPDIMKSFLDDRFQDRETVSKKEQVKLLRSRFQFYTTIPKIAEAVGCSPQYARRVLSRGGEYRSEDIPQALRSEVLERDGVSCVKCGCKEEEELQLHHITRGPSTVENLATLCFPCHQKAHGGSFDGPLIYENQETFWNEWIRS